MKFIISRYNQEIDWLKKYTTDWPKDVVIYDRSEDPIEWANFKPANIGSDIYDKFTFIIDNYDNLPEVAVYTKCNIFQFISQEEFEKILARVEKKKQFVPLLTQNHKTYMPVCFYDAEGMYNEINNRWYLNDHPCKHLGRADELSKLLNLTGKEYLKFAPGSNYILTKENIRKHPKEFYIKLRSYLEHGRYPGEAQIMERGLYYLWS